MDHHFVWVVNCVGALKYTFFLLFLPTVTDGACYVGEFKCGVKHGLGCYHFRNGDRYCREYFGDKIHGFGTYHFANGHYYEGSWHEGRKQGYGNYTFRNGERKCGEWDCGVLKNPQPQFNDAVLQAVQVARKAANSAIHIGRVDEQVNKAVITANRAAAAARVAAVKIVQNSLHETCRHHKEYQTVLSQICSIFWDVLITWSVPMKKTFCAGLMVMLSLLSSQAQSGSLLEPSSLYL